MGILSYWPFKISTKLAVPKESTTSKKMVVKLTEAWSFYPYWEEEEQDTILEIQKEPTTYKLPKTTSKTIFTPKKVLNKAQMNDNPQLLR
jgi:hypothetical protein